MKRLGTLGLAVLVALDIVLVAAAFRHTYAPAPRTSTSPSAPSPAAAEGQKAQAGPQESLSESAGAPAPAPYVADMVENALVVRAASAGCEDGSGVIVETSSNGGIDFVGVRVPGLRSVLAAEVLDADRARLVGADEACDVVGWSTADAGATWQREETPAGLWSIAPVGEDTVFSPGGPVAAPCRPLSVSGVDQAVARVLCRDGVIMGTSTAGQEWARLGDVAGARSLAYLTPTRGYVVSADADCPTAVRLTLDAGASWEPATCPTRDRPATITADGSVVLVLTPDGVWASRDEGADWSAR